MSTIIFILVLIVFFAKPVMTNLQINSQIQPLLFELLFLIQARMKQVVKDTDANLSPLQILVLRTLVEQGEMSQQSLAQTIAKDKAQITRLIHELEDKKFILKQRNQQDRRGFIIKASPDVHEKVSSFIEYEKKIVSEMLQGASKSEIKNFEKMLLLMIQNLQG